MPYCPSCTYEYEDYVHACPDCGVRLAPGAGPVALPQARENAKPDYRAEMGQFIRVANAPNMIMATLLQSQLEDAGIPVLLKTSVGADVGDWSRNDFVAQDIWTPEKLAIEARRLIYGPDLRRHSSFNSSSFDDTDGAFVESPLALDPYDVPSTGSTLWLALDTPAPPAQSEADWRRLPTQSEYLSQRRRRKLRGGEGEQFYSDSPVADEYYEEEYADDAAPGSDWQRRRMYRWLMGILMLAWTIPFLLQFFHITGEFFDRLFK